MASDGSGKPRRKDNYFHQTQRPLNCLVFILPGLVFFHVGSAVYGGSRLLVPQWVGQVLRYFGGTAAFLPPLLIVVTLLLVHAAHKDPWKIHPKALAGMFGESIAWTLPLIALGFFTRRIAAQPGSLLTAEGDKLLQNVLLAFGAGIYEEFIFRFLLISLALLIFVDLATLRKDIVTFVAVLAGAGLFSLCHFTGESVAGDTAFNWSQFTFLATAGVLWGTLFVYRGFGIAVGAHIFWDLYVLASR
ncbi:MAG TPA: CPBP family intramembrane metalloprotease [Phycisphaerae bacterium]|nr:CPBP family intramembrane metalloprotease [Phycisphaerae bacterium]